MKNPSNKTYDAVENAIESSKALRGTSDELARRSNIELWEDEVRQGFSEPSHPRLPQSPTKAQPDI